MEKAYADGKARAIGVSNFQACRFYDFASVVDVKPAVNQLQCCVLSQQRTILLEMARYDTKMMAWGPLGQGSDDLLKSPVLAAIGAKYGKTPAQVALRWLIERGIVAIPKSTHKERMEANFDIFDFSLSQEDIASYLSGNMLNADALVFTDTDAGKTLILPAEQWALVTDVQLNMFIEENGCYVDLGMDSLYSSDGNGNLVADTEKTWVAIDGTPVPYYQLIEPGDSSGYYGGYVPALLDGDRVQLLIAFDENGTGYLVGFRYDYQAGETETVAKTISGLPVGATIQLLCDRYLSDGTYEAAYNWGKPITVTENTLKVSDVYLDQYNVRRSYRLTDIYNQVYWTESY